MKSFHILFTFLVGIGVWTPSSLDAQTTVQVGYSALGTDNAPINTRNDYHYSQSIYTAADLIADGATGAGTISKIRYYRQPGGSPVNSTSWTVYIGNTTKTSFLNPTDWIPSTSMTICYSANVTFSSGWMEIPLTTPFLWNGTDNIVVGIDENQPGIAASAIFWNYTEYGSARTLFSGGATNPNPTSPPTGFMGNWAPNIQFEFNTPTNPTSPCSPTSSNFSDYNRDFRTTGGIANINDTDYIFGSPGYKNKYATLFASQVAGSSLSFSVTTIGTNVQFKIWVDWNSNNLFESTEELFYGQNNGTNPSFSGNFTIPSVATGDYRMRIRCVGGSGATLTPCDNIAWGEARDYKITVASLPNCTGTPVSGVITAPATVCMASPYTVSASGTSTATGISFQWQSSSTGGTPWTNVGAATSIVTNLNVANFSGSIFYRLATTCTVSAITAYSNVIGINVTPTFNCNLSITAWYKADANVTVAGASKISAWKSTVGAYDLTQATDSKRPNLILGASNYKLFNYNKRVKFNKTNLTRLANTTTPTDHLGADGTVFLVLNKTNGSGTGTSFAYDPDGSINTNRCYQFNPSCSFSPHHLLIFC